MAGADAAKIGDVTVGMRLMAAGRPNADGTFDATAVVAGQTLTAQGSGKIVIDDTTQAPLAPASPATAESPATCTSPGTDESPEASDAPKAPEASVLPVWAWTRYSPTQVSLIGLHAAGSMPRS